MFNFLLFDATAFEIFRNQHYGKLTSDQCECQGRLYGLAITKRTILMLKYMQNRNQRSHNYTMSDCV